MSNNIQNRAKQLLNARRSHYVNRDGIGSETFKSSYTISKAQIRLYRNIRR